MRKVITEAELLEAMRNPERIKSLLLLPESIFVETSEFNIEGTALRYYGITKVTKRELFELGLFLISSLPREEQIQIISGLKFLKIPSSLWYKIYEDNTISSYNQPFEEPNTMSSEANDNAKTILAEAQEVKKQAEAIAAGAAETLAAVKHELEKQKNQERIRDSSFWGKWGGKITKVSFLLLGVAIGAAAQSKYGSAKSEPISGGLGE